MAAYATEPTAGGADQIRPVFGIVGIPVKHVGWRYGAASAS